MFLSDCIVVWRTWILWGRSKIVLVASATILLCALGATCLLRWSTDNSACPSVLFAMWLSRISFGHVVKNPGTVSLELVLSFAISVVINLFTTILVGIRTWYVLHPRCACSALTEVA
jgi:hypothetical protein